MIITIFWDFHKKWIDPILLYLQIYTILLDKYCKTHVLARNQMTNEQQKTIDKSKKYDANFTAGGILYNEFIVLKKIS